MEKLTPRSENVLSLEVKYGSGRTKSHVIQRFLEGDPIQFLCTRMGDFYLTYMGNKPLIRTNGIDSSDIATRGYLKIDKQRHVHFEYEEYVPLELKKPITEVIDNFKKEAEAM